MDAGKLDRRITLEYPSQAQGASGGVQSTWVAVPPVWASVRNFNGAERRATAAGGGEVAVARTEFTIRYRADVTPLWRVAYGGRYYNILHMNNFMERNESLILTCDTGANDG